MTKDLFLIRHAESSHPSGVSDFDRPLSEKGYSEAEKMSLKLKQYKPLPEFIISSPAKRALNTAMIFAEILNHPIQPENMIYEATVSSLLSIVNHLPDEQNRVALFGHNPGITEFAEYLTRERIGNIPTAGIVHIQFSSDSWETISRGLGEIKWEAGPNL